MNVEMISSLLEAAMILCFGLSWPISIRKSWVARTAKGKSLFFEVFIWKLAMYSVSQEKSSITPIIRTRVGCSSWHGRSIS